MIPVHGAHEAVVCRFVAAKSASKPTVFIVDGIAPAPDAKIIQNVKNPLGEFVQWGTNCHRQVREGIGGSLALEQIPKLQLILTSFPNQRTIGGIKPGVGGQNSRQGIAKFATPVKGLSRGLRKTIRPSRRLSASVDIGEALYQDRIEYVTEPVFIGGPRRHSVQHLASGLLKFVEMVDDLDALNRGAKGFESSFNFSQIAGIKQSLDHDL